jgi:Phosphoenolpyruvate hydrolase-like
VRPLGARLYPPRWPARLCRPPQDGPRQPLTAISAQDNDAQRVIAATHGVVGFFGVSSMERLPTEVAMTENMKRFKAITIQEGR